MSRKKTPKRPGYPDRLLVGWTCANGAKNAGFSKWYKFVNAYVERDKRKLEKCEKGQRSAGGV